MEMDAEYLEKLKSALTERGYELAAGMTDEEIRRAEETFNFVFPPDLRQLLQTFLPISDGFPDWREGKVRDLLDWLDEPIEGICFDVEENAFWVDSWGERPGDIDDAIEEARRHVTRQPLLIPIFSHRFLPAQPVSDGNPVFSVVQSDVLRYGDDLEDYFQKEFEVPRSSPQPFQAKRIAFWSELAGESRI
jgi:hypothetical protein